MQRNRRSLASGLAAFGVVALVLTLGTPQALAGHWATSGRYSIVWEDSRPNQYFGVGVTRYDAIVNCGGLGGAGDVFHPVFQPQWVRFPGSGNWAEFGTWHCRNGTTKWYWGAGIAGAWQYDGERTATAGQAHRFRLTLKAGYPNCNWRVLVDTTEIGQTRPFCDEGARIDAGLESYNPNAVTTVDDSALQEQRTLNGAWFSWAGRDGQSVNAPMCGRWLSDTQWRAGENTTC